MNSMYQLIIADSSHDGDYVTGLNVEFHRDLSDVCGSIVGTAKSLLWAGEDTPQAFLDAAEQAVADGLKASVEFLNDCERARFIVTDLNSVEELEEVENEAVQEAARAAIDAGALSEDDQSWLTDYNVRVYEVPDELAEVSY